METKLSKEYITLLKHSYDVLLGVTLGLFYEQKATCDAFEQICECQKILNSIINNNSIDITNG